MLFPNRIWLEWEQAVLLPPGDDKDDAAVAFSRPGDARAVTVRSGNAAADVAAMPKHVTAIRADRNPAARVFSKWVG